MRGEPKVRGAETGDPLKLIKDPHTGQTLMKAGGGVWTLPGSLDEIRVRERRLWLYREGNPICQLATPGVGGSTPESLPDGEDKGDALAWSGVNWALAKHISVDVGSFGIVASGEFVVGDATLTPEGIRTPSGDLIEWSAVEKLLKLDLDAPHGLPLLEKEGVLQCDIPIEAPNLREFAWRSELERLEGKVQRLVPEIQGPPGGSVAFDVTPDGEMVVTIRKAGRRFRGKLILEEV